MTEPTVVSHVRRATAIGVIVGAALVTAAFMFASGSDGGAPAAPADRIADVRQPTSSTVPPIAPQDAPSVAEVVPTTDAPTSPTTAAVPGAQVITEPDPAPDTTLPVVEQPAPVATSTPTTISTDPCYYANPTDSPWCFEG